ncbi:hypothetical protein QBC35DRAFT_495629 [Podospora australis]|uniref:ribonuclease Z n=1 Tax=Podospora australis TaxID=1536484 RepID=A0AAN7AJ83_9PEZI|nr:hypothetical protein QBC35DRAFT_495629 [Podospora australis]
MYPTKNLWRIDPRLARRVLLQTITSHQTTSSLPLRPPSPLETTEKTSETVEPVSWSPNPDSTAARKVAQTSGLRRPPLLRNYPSTLPPKSIVDLTPEQVIVELESSLSTRTSQDPRTAAQTSSPRLDQILVPETEPNPLKTAPVPYRTNRIMLAYVQVVGTPTADTPGACLVLHFDDRRYLFGRVAEGTQRLMVQRKLALAKIRNIFITGTVKWDSVGGLLGMILSVADVISLIKTAVDEHNEKKRAKGGKEKTNPAELGLSLTGGKNLTHVLATARHFIFRKGLALHVNEISSDSPAQRQDRKEPDYEDDNIRVWNLPISRCSSPGKKRKLSTSSEPSEDFEESEAKNQHIRESLVKDMFGSNWSLDTLQEVSLDKVDLPAKIFIRKDNQIQPYEGPMPGGSEPLPDIKVLVRLPWPAAKLENIPTATASTESMSYIIKTHPRRGKFDPVEATRLGVEKPDCKKLTAGESVTTKTGNVVTPEMVMSPPTPGTGIAVLDVPSQDLVPGLLNRPEWSDPELMKGINAIYWISSEEFDVRSDSSILEFIEKHSSLKHFFLGHEVTPNLLALEDPARQLIKMNRIDPDRFPVPVYSEKPASSEVSNGLVSASGDRMMLSPREDFDTEMTVPVLDVKKPLEELQTDCADVITLADAARQQISDPTFLAQVAESQADIPDLDTEIITLGTGSALPSKYRNVSATLIRVPGHGSFLLDCGENTLGQLRRCFGFSGADDVLRDLRGIYISHAHADHHLGMASVISRWSTVTSGSSPNLSLIATRKLQTWFSEYASVDAAIDNSRIVRVLLSNNGLKRWNINSKIGTTITLPGQDGSSSSFLQPEDIGLPRIEACYVDHCHDALAAVFTFPHSGLKIAYSGDCRPSTRFAEIGKGAHMLLHECTFEDSLQGDALAKKHSTLSEALTVGREMQARRILLTHFSQRYPKLPALPPVASDIVDGQPRKGDQAVVFAFDHMRVKLGEFRQAAAFIPALRLLLDEEAKEEEGETEEGEGEWEEG